MGGIKMGPLYGMENSVTWKEYLQKEHDTRLVKLETDRAKDDVDLAQTLQLVEENEMKFRAADVDKTGSLDLAEFAAFTHPYDYEHMHEFEALAMEEAVHLIHETDSNRDGQLSMDEILDKYTLWVGSAAQTDTLHEEL
ncbi:hypothetical protein NP493_4326g00001 [Ridgeia piscesae]|uniref:EF-hand domain-containing protein n=1 Tax=Ridgeia piscesae TaxID=27915 RepID=A0AAD9J0Y9_RIDPI|nr:hypothetical protein NP493_4326g00001 [Ridgeia piscesae]